MKVYPTTISRRVGASVIDYIIMSVISGAIGTILVTLGSAGTSKWLMLTLAVIFYGAILFYLPICEAFFDGKTAGKAAVGIRVVRSDGSPASGLQCLQRYLMLAIDLPLTLGLGGLISTLVTQKRQRIGDIVADTVVVRDNSQVLLAQAVTDVHAHTDSRHEAELTRRINPYMTIDKSMPPLHLAKMYRAAQCDIAMLRTRKSDPRLIEYMERLLSSIHIGMFRHGIHTWVDMLTLTLKSIPRAVYEARWAVLASLAVSVIAYIIGLYSQAVNPDFFEDMFGPGYTNMTIDNIANGDPMGVYSTTGPYEMFFDIFFNNLIVTLKLYVYGVFIFVGPVLMLLNNFVSFAAFDMFFVQRGLAVDAFVTPNEHGVLELSSIIMAGGASILLGTGWLFPGRLTRLQALIRSARHSMLIVASTIPMLFVAAFIESFVTRHTEWPMAAKLTIIIASSIIITGYYVMLPIIAKRH